MRPIATRIEQPRQGQEAPRSPGISRLAVRQPEEGHHDRQGRDRADRPREHQPTQTDDDHHGASRAGKQRGRDREDDDDRGEQTHRVLAVGAFETVRQVAGESGRDERAADFVREDCAQHTEDHAEVADGARDVRNDPDQTQGLEEPQHGERRFGERAGWTEDDDGIERDGEAEEPEGHLSLTDVGAATVGLSTPSEDQPDHQRDVEGVGDAQVDAAERQGVAIPPENHSRTERTEGPLGSTSSPPRRTTRAQGRRAATESARCWGADRCPRQRGGQRG